MSIEQFTLTITRLSSGSAGYFVALPFFGNGGARLPFGGVPPAGGVAPFLAAFGLGFLVVAI